MTNRPDMIDSAITRPGRLEIKIEIGLPDARGRSQILSIHTAGMRKKKVLQPDVDLDILTRKTKNFTGQSACDPCLKLEIKLEMTEPVIPSHAANLHHFH